MRNYFVINKSPFLLVLVISLSACNVEELTEELNELYNCETTDEIKEKTIKLVNEARSVSKQCGSEYFYPAPPITWNDSLQKAAQEHSDNMANDNFFEHIGLDGSNPGDRIINQGYNWIIYGENIFAGVHNSQEAIDGWLKSAGHCTNIMNPEFKEMGIACSHNIATKYTTYWTQVFAVSY